MFEVRILGTTFHTMVSSGNLSTKTKSFYIYVETTSSMVNIYNTSKLDSETQDGKVTVRLPCCDERAVLADLENEEPCPECGNIFDVYLAPVSDDSEKIQTKLFKRKERSLQHVSCIDADVDETIAGLVENLNSAGFDTKYCCSGLYKDHFSTETLDEFDMDTAVQEFIEGTNYYMSMPNITLYDCYDISTSISNATKLEEFIESCLKPSDWKIKINVTVTGDRSSQLYRIRPRYALFEDIETFEEYEELVEQKILSLNDAIKEVYLD